MIALQKRYPANAPVTMHFLSHVYLGDNAPSISHILCTFPYGLPFQRMDHLHCLSLPLIRGEYSLMTSPILLLTSLFSQNSKMTTSTLNNRREKKMLMRVATLGITNDTFRDIRLDTPAGPFPPVYKIQPRLRIVANLRVGGCKKSGPRWNQGC